MKSRDNSENILQIMKGKNWNIKWHMKSYMGTAVKEMNIEAILAIMNTTELVDEIRPVWKKIQARMDLNFFQALFQLLAQ